MMTITISLVAIRTSNVVIGHNLAIPFSLVCNSIGDIRKIPPSDGPMIAVYEIAPKCGNVIQTDRNAQFFCSGSATARLLWLLYRGDCLRRIEAPVASVSIT